MDCGNDIAKIGEWREKKIVLWQMYLYLGEKHLLVPTFSGDSHFSLYILFLPLLVSILKKASRFLAVTSEKEKADMANGRDRKSVV